MKTTTNKERCNAYLEKYADKDIKAIDEMFADGIVLRDWKIRVVGKKDALRETKKNFDTVNSITIDVLSTYESENTVAAELKIVVDEMEELYVVDVVTFDGNFKIASIRAYLGRGDE